MNSVPIAEKPRRRANPRPVGLVFNVMRFAVRDGPGIRTAVFLKGCPLNCWWCHNPEGRAGKIEVAYVVERCIACGDCVRACPEGALELDGRIVRDATLCRQHSRCAEVCPTSAQEVVGRWLTVTELMPQLLRDQIFFDESGGGITLTGGEPLLQADFVEALLTACHAQRIHTAVETCGYIKERVLARIRQNVDLFLFDLKVMDSDKHKQFTGVRNDLILANLRMLADSRSAVIVRVPVIPGVNDDEANLNAISKFLSSLGLRTIDLLPYHRIAGSKYSQLGLTYRTEELLPPSEEHVQAIAARFRKGGFHVQIGGAS